jgi:putative DNA primase/helicase
MSGAAAKAGSNGHAKMAFYADRDRRPTVLAVEPDGTPDDLKRYLQWVAWRLDWRDKTWTKRPINPRDGSPASSTDSLTWGSFAEALALCRGGRADGLGFTFSSGDPFAGIDLDDCRDPATGEVADWAVAVIKEIDSYTEVSPSGSGLKIIARGKLPGRGRKKLFGGGEIEMYDRERYFALTGRAWRPAP